MNQTTFDFAEYSANQDTVEKIACSERPQHRLEHFGVASLSDTELLAIIIQGSGGSVEKALAAASKLMAEGASISGLASRQPPDFCRVKGIGRRKSLQLATIAEIARRMIAGPVTPPVILNRAEVIAALFRSRILGLQVEKFWVNCLGRRNNLMKIVELTKGTATAALAHPREVYREAVRHGATAIVCVHNHPSGDPAPSAPDLHVTRLLREAARAVDIALVDHVIVGRPESDPCGRGYFSFKEAGLL